MKKRRLIRKICMAALMLAAMLAVLSACARKDPTAHEETVEITDAFSAVAVQNRTYEMTVAASEDGTVRAVFDASPKMTCTASVENGVLTVRQTDLRKWYEKIFSWWKFGKRKLTLYLPAGEYGDLTVNSSSGGVAMKTGPFTFGNTDIQISSGSFTAEGLFCKALSVRISSGNAALSGCEAVSLSMKVSSGNMKLTETTVIGHSAVTLSSGSVMMEKFDAATAEIRVSSGNVKGTILTAKNFETETSSGTIRIPDSDSAAGKWKIKVSSGSVDLSLAAG